jgi:hypothetical protein
MLNKIKLFNINTFVFVESISYHSLVNETIRSYKRRDEALPDKIEYKTDQNGITRFVIVNS